MIGPVSVVYFRVLHCKDLNAVYDKCNFIIVLHTDRRSLCSKQINTKHKTPVHSVQIH